MTEYVLDDRYELIERIASGGMGEVWRGNDQMLGRPVAIKLLSSVHAGDGQFRARFRAEARYAAALSHHPGIARVYDYGESSPLGGPYLVMELVNGEPLSTILDREVRLSPEATLDIVSQAARALDVAHQAGIVHRDIKPGNLLITADGITKITDFGIAKAHSAQAAQLTATGIVMGTALYVSPEQATGAPVTGASDIYSLGIVAYECLTGEPPFMAEQPLAIAIMHKHDPVPPLPPDIPAPVSDLVMAMLAKSPEARPESARHVADRADVIMDARATFGEGGDFSRHTAGLPVVPDYPEPAEDFYPDYPERTAGFPPGRHRLAAAGMGAALCGIGALVAVVLSFPGHHIATTGGVKSTSASQVASPTTATLHTSQGGTGVTGTNLETAPRTLPARSAQPTTSHHASAGPTPDTPPTSVAPTTPSASTPTSPPASASSTPPTTPPTTSPPSPSKPGKANVGGTG